MATATDARIAFSLAILGAPQSSPGAATAYRFAAAALADGHRIHRLFFYGDGVHNGSMLAVVPRDDFDLPEHWRRLIGDHGLDAVVCIASGARRGILSAAEASRYGKPAGNLAPAFQLGGLGELVDAALNSDRLILFGN